MSYDNIKKVKYYMGDTIKIDVEGLVTALEDLPFWEDLCSFLASRGQKAYLLGGILRDLLLGRSSKDYDIGVSGDFLTFTRDFAKTIDAKFIMLNRRYGLVRLQKKGELQLDCSSLAGGNIEEDLAKRDFTINAMAVEIPPNSEPWRPILIDPFSGFVDLRSGTIRIVPPDPFSEDPLRMLRAFRMTAELGFELHPETLRTVGPNVPHLHKAAPERIRDEWMKILATDRAGDVVGIMDNCGLLEQFLKELEALKGITQNEPHHLDVWEHSLMTLKNIEILMRDLPETFPTLCHSFEKQLLNERGLNCSGRALLKFAALLHDGGKPSARSTDEKGRVRFFHHERKGEEIAKKICLRLKFSTRQTRTIQRWIRNHMKPGHLFSLQSPSKRVIGRFFRHNMEDYPALFLLFLADILSTLAPEAAEDGFSKALSFVHEMLAVYEKEIRCSLEKDRLINGHDLIERLELQPGPIFSAILNDVELLRAEGLISSKDEALLWVKDQYGL